MLSEVLLLFPSQQRGRCAPRDPRAPAFPLLWTLSCSLPPAPPHMGPALFDRNSHSEIQGHPFSVSFNRVCLRVFRRLVPSFVTFNLMLPVELLCRLLGLKRELLHVSPGRARRMRAESSKQPQQQKTSVMLSPGWMTEKGSLVNQNTLLSSSFQALSISTY